jgi:hypothetical protein
MNEQQPVIPAPRISPVRVLRIENADRDPYVFGVKDIRRIDVTEEHQPAGVTDKATPSAGGPVRSLNIYELVNCTL